MESTGSSVPRSTTPPIADFSQQMIEENIKHLCLLGYANPSVRTVDAFFEQYLSPVSTMPAVDSGMRMLTPEMTLRERLSPVSTEVEPILSVPLELSSGSQSLSQDPERDTEANKQALELDEGFHRAPDKWYQCDFCGKKMQHRHHIVEHVSSQHTGRKLFRCTLCGEEFTTHSRCYYHMRSKHKDSPGIQPIKIS
ncbi:hypothetical protein [Kistimonas asteriae]|uniref:hypothetical protein n=1 Tax=Kistimonas asteriae TaxID=517724 RepID=UPI001BACD811|nr:hypothetical protein [Kistimonas asteriae]